MVAPAQEENFKKLVRNKLGMKRVTLGARKKLWNMLNQTNKNKFGNWKPPAKKAPAPKKVQVLKAPVPKKDSEFIMPQNIPSELRKKIINILTKEGPPSGVNAQAHLMKRIQEIIKNEQQFSKAPTIALEPSTLCVLGKGAYGKVCMRQAWEGSKKYAVKTVTGSGNSFSDLMKEKATHMKFYYGLPNSLKKYFPQPVNVEDEPNAYAMTLFRGETLYHLLVHSGMGAEDKKNIIKELRKAVFAMWTSGYIHGDLHMNNIMIRFENDKPIIQILDFGMMRKSNLNVPNKKFKNQGNVGYKNLTQRWEKWFKDSWKKQLKNLGIPTSNPNMIVFPQKMGNLGYYATRHKEEFKTLNRYANQPNKPPALKKAPTPKPPAARGLAKQRMEKYKQLVRNRMGVKRVTIQAQAALWKKLSNKNKEQFGSWKPEAAVKRRTSPPKPKKAPAPKSPTTKPTMNQFMAKAIGGKNVSTPSLLRFWMTRYTTAQKKEIYTKVSNPVQAKKDFPLCM